LNKLLIIGASGHGKVIADIALTMGWKEIQFLDAKWPKLENFAGWPVIGKDIDFMSHNTPYNGFFVAIGDNLARAKISNLLSSKNVRVETLIHPRAFVSNSVDIGEGSVIMPGATINCGSKLGKGVIINTGSTVDHDCLLGSYIHISPGVNLAGGVMIKDFTWIGIGSCVKENLKNWFASCCSAAL